MHRKAILMLTALLASLALVGLLWAVRPRQVILVNPWNQSQAVRTPLATSTPASDTQQIIDTLTRAIRIIAEADYTFDTSHLAEVYINDPRGGEITEAALADIRRIRGDATIRKDQVGILDYEQARVLDLKNKYDAYIADLRAKQHNGTISAEEKAILTGETEAWPTWVPPTPVPTQCFSAEGIPAWAGYPAARLTALPTATAIPTLYPGANTPAPTQTRPGRLCPTPIPTSPPPPHWVPYRGADPALFPPRDLAPDAIKSITIDGDVAKAVVTRGEVTSEYILVKVNGRWYIAG